MNTAQQSTSDGKASYGYMPALDGFRAISILLVLFSHGGFHDIIPGGLGVHVFFVISGFLITRQMIVEIESTGTLNIRNFYLRRIFRLAPALIFFIFFFSIVLSHLGVEISLMHILSGLFYFANYYHIFFGYTENNHISILWSLAVEEHYYILFPFFILLFRKRLRAMLPWLFLTVAAVLAWRYCLYFMCSANPQLGLCGLSIDDRIYKGTDTIFDCILYGSITALLLQYHNAIIRRMFINTPAFVLALAILLLTLLYRDTLFRDTIRYTIQSVAISTLIVNVLFGRGLSAYARRVLTVSPLLFIGRLSYSLYLCHYGVLSTIGALQKWDDIHKAKWFIGYFGASFLFAMISYYGIEKPMIKVRKRIGAHPATTSV